MIGPVHGGLGRHEPVIGLEVHCQLQTGQKLFCACPADAGAPPNQNTCPICLGLPGVLPVLDPGAVALAIKAGLALGCQINQRSVFARKHYFYPDLPKGYQITQYDQPLAVGGRLEIDQATIGVTRIHLEEDAGKSSHDDPAGTLIDLNRAGVPLVEIVSEPDLRTPEQAVAYLRALRGIVRWLGICDGNMEAGSFRCDANVSLRPAGSSALGIRTELKNLNAFRGVARALRYEIERQAQVIEAGEVVAQETRLWDDAAGRTRATRSKEDAHDYRYFPEPDLPALCLREGQVEALAAALPELPQARRERLERDWGLSTYDSGVITAERALADYFEAAVAARGAAPEDRARSAKAICGWLTTELLGRLGGAAEVESCRLRPAGLARLVERIESGAISGRQAKQVFAALLESGGDPDALIEARGLRQLADPVALREIIERIVAAHPSQAEALRAGKAKLVGYFVGQVMGATAGRASPQLTRALLEQVIAGSKGAARGREDG